MYQFLLFLFLQVHGKRFVYKFVCDLKQMLGYSASELNALVIEAELKAKHKNKINQVKSSVIYVKHLSIFIQFYLLICYSYMLNVNFK